MMLLLLMGLLLVCRQSFDLKRGCDLHENRQLVVFHIDHPLVHELQQGRHYIAGHILENDWIDGEERREED